MRKILTWQWFRNMVAPTGNPSDGVYLYAEGGVLKVRQADGSVIPVILAQASDGDLTAIAALGSTGLAVRTNTNAWALRSIAVGSAMLTITNESGAAGNPTLDFIPSAVVGLPRTALLGGTLPIMRTYTTSQTWTKPASATFLGVMVEIQGGGGGSGGCSNTAAGNTSGGGGGKGGAYARFWVPAASLGGTESVTVGSGGAAGAAGANSGGTGGQSSFGAHGAAVGGSAGAGGGAAAPSWTSQNGGAVVQTFSGSASPVLFVAGSDGGTGYRLASSVSVLPGYGGGSHLAGQQRSSSIASGVVLAAAGQLYGGGASGPGNASSGALSAQPGEVGGQGIVVVTEFYS